MKPTYLTLALALGAMCFSACGSDEEEMNYSNPSKPQNDGSVAVTECPDNHHPHLIDLGLPSGTKWACCNVGAKTPQDFGEYYAWGEAQNKTQKQAGNKYTWGTYSHYSVGDRGEVSWTNIGMDITGTQWDAAHIFWQGKWQMPTQAQVKELIDNCRRQWELGEKDEKGKYHGTGAYMVSKINKAKIFFPAASYYTDKGVNAAYGEATIWSSSAVPNKYELDTPDKAIRMRIYNTDVKTEETDRYWGLSIRAIAK